MNGLGKTAVEIVESVWSQKRMKKRDGKSGGPGKCFRRKQHARSASAKSAWEGPFGRRQKLRLQRGSPVLSTHSTGRRTITGELQTPPTNQTTNERAARVSESAPKRVHFWANFFGKKFVLALKTSERRVDIRGRVESLSLI